MKIQSKLFCAATVGVALLLALACQQPDLSGPFRQACTDAFSRPVDNDNPKLIHAQDNWVFHRGELAFTRAGRFWGADAITANPQAPPERADPMPAILHFQRQLAAHHIELLFVPVPPRQEIYPESVLGPEQMNTMKRVPRLDPNLGEFLAALEHEGVRVFDVTPLLLDHRNDEHGPLFLPSDPHLTPYAIELVARALAKELKRNKWYDATPKSRLVEHRRTIDYEGPTWRLFKKATGQKLGTEQVAVRSITQVNASGERKLEMHNPSSPILILGDSQSRWWREQKSSFFEQLSYELGFAVDLIEASGGGANTARLELGRMAREDVTTLARVRSVVWYFSAIALANEPDGWLSIPLPPPAEPI